MSAAWECPRCHVVNAPHVDRCECKPVEAQPVFVPSIWPTWPFQPSPHGGHCACPQCVPAMWVTTTNVPLTTWLGSDGTRVEVPAYPEPWAETRTSHHFS